MSDYDAMEMPERKNKITTKLENRYVVLKREDIKNYLSATEENILTLLANKVDYLRGGSVTGLVLESDWPEFESAQKALLDRINARE